MQLAQTKNKFKDAFQINVSDYITNGKTATQAIKDAIAASKSGDILNFGDMDFVITENIAINKRLKLTGNGRIVLGGAGFDVFTLNVAGSVVDGLEFINPDGYVHPDITKFTTGHAIVAWESNCVIINNRIDNYCGGIIFGKNGGGYDGCIISNNIVTNLNGLNTGFPNDGILSLCRNAQIIGNRVEVKIGLDARGGIVADLDALKTIITGNAVIGNHSVKVGIHVERSPHSIISHNVIRSPKQQGMTTSNYCIMTDNSIETPSTVDPNYHLDQSGIFGYGSTGLTIERNKIICLNSEVYGVRMSTGKHQNINDNHFIGEPNSIKVGILCHIITDSKISRNTFEDNVCVDAAIKSAAGSLNISDNHITGGKYGLDLRAADHSIISRNVIKNTVDGAIYLYNAIDPIVESNMLFDNQNTKTQKHGIVINNLSNHKVSYVYNNTILNSIVSKILFGSFSGQVYVNDIESFHVKSPNGTRYKVNVSDTGVLSVVTGN